VAAGNAEPMRMKGRTNNCHRRRSMADPGVRIMFVCEEVLAFGTVSHLSAKTRCCNAVVPDLGMAGGICVENK